MAKQKDRSELEYLRAENRRLVSENKSIKRQLSRLNKRSYEPETSSYEPTFDEYEVTDPNKCKVCSKGKIKKSDLGIRTIITCDSCSYREVRKNK